ncbi:hypothetical protein RF11_07601 [Thelohanellus kitauei]|uniref:Uncharacterized protein n=1 Tax=Thelohanellus kitauei TaxID=669202 RepID=A0A0C2MWY5_THEKT|nr:hypothetical protein RF11_07601 [Thelohanellus kitauei]
MLHRLRLLNEIQFWIKHFFVITFKKFLRFKKPHNSTFVLDLSKMWIRLINGSKNKYQIDIIEELIFICAVFSLNFTHKLKKVNEGYGNFELTKIKKHGLCLIYFTLFSFPMFDHTAKTWLRNVLKVLHASFKKYFEQFSLEDMPIENQFYLLQYYLKSHVALQIKLSSRDEELFKAVFNRLITYPSLSNII